VVAARDEGAHPAGQVFQDCVKTSWHDNSKFPSAMEKCFDSSVGGTAGRTLAYSWSIAIFEENAMKAKLWLCALSLAGLCAVHGAARADENNTCDAGGATPYGLKPQAGDVVQPRHLSLTRAFAGTGKLSVNICNADVRLVNRPDALRMELTVQMDGSDGSHNIADYVKSFSVQPDSGLVEMKFSKAARAHVTLTLPMKRGEDFEFNLGRGDLEFVAGNGAGERQINVGMGSVKMLVGDAPYGSMQVNIGMGSLHDHRPGESDGHFVVSKEYQAKGDGSLQINVGMGRMEIRQD
jgi:hypothetical protein